MISFIDYPRFPDAVSYNCQESTNFSNTKTVVNSGFVKTNINWDAPLLDFTVSKGLQTPEQIKELRAFFIATFGGAIGFRFKNWLGYQVSKNEGSVNGGEELTKTFQLCKKFVLNGSYTAHKAITKPVNASLYSARIKPIKIYLNDVLVEPENYVINYTNGLVTLNDEYLFDSSDVVSWEGEYDLPVNFRDDKQTLSMSNFDAINWDSIGFTEIRE